MSFTFTSENSQKIEEICTHYPADRRQSALLPVLDMAQRQNGGWLSHDALEAVADIIGISVLKVYEVATFYSMYHLKPVGKYHIQWCGTTPCWLRGAQDVATACQKHLGLENSGHDVAMTQDGLFSMQEVECLGACVNAPIIQINDDFFEDLDEKSAVALLDACRNTGLPKPYSALQRQCSAPQGFVSERIILDDPDSKKTVKTTPGKTKAPQPAKKEGDHAKSK